MRYLLPSLLVVLAYVAGSFPTGVLLARARGVDLRKVGSGNIGATNVGRALGKKTGRVVLLLDGLKGLLPVLAVRLALPGEDRWIAATAVAAVVGHLFPIWHGLRGGKGVATTAGAMLMAVPIAGALMAVTYVVLRKLTKRSSVGSLAGTAVALAATAALGHAAPWQDPPGAGRTFAIMAAAITALVFVRHVGNIRRLLRGEELPS